MKKTPIYTLQQYAEQMGYFDSYRDIKIIYFDNYNFLKEKYKGEIDTTYVLTTYTNLINCIKILKIWIKKILLNIIKRIYLKYN